MPLADQITSFPPSLPNLKENLKKSSFLNGQVSTFPSLALKNTHTPTSLQIHLHLAAEKTQPPTHQTNPKKQCHFERPHGLPWSSSHDHTLGPPRALKKRILVGGWTNPSEKKARQIGSFSQVRVKIKNISNHYLGIRWYFQRCRHVFLPKKLLEAWEEKWNNNPHHHTKKIKMLLRMDSRSNKNHHFC